MKKNNKHSLIVIEGGDGSGKGTQVALLIDVLNKKGHNITTQDFPRYETSLFGALCGRALKGEFGDFRNMSPYLASLPYTLDRVSARDEIIANLESGHVVCNRYTPSNVAFQASKINGKKEKSEFVTFLENAEYGELRLPKPDLVIYLHVPVLIAHKLVAQKEARAYMGKKKGVHDQHEKDTKFQEAVINTYLGLAKARPDWVVINCVRRGKLLSREEIHSMVLAAVEEVL